MAVDEVKIKRYPELQFGGFTDVDGTIAFYNRVRALLRPDNVVLDVGCGRGARSADPCAFRRDTSILKGRCRRVIGLDVDAGAKVNALVDEFRLVQKGPWPVADNSVNMILSDWVLEHVDNPVSYFQECGRVLCAGGYYCARTSNRWGYVALANRMLPSSVRLSVLKISSPGRDALDVFPLRYQCNTIGMVRRMLRDCGMNAFAVYGYEAEPSYLNFSKILYRCGCFWQKHCVNCLKNSIFIFAQK